MRRSIVVSGISAASALTVLLASGPIANALSGDSAPIVEIGSEARPGAASESPKPAEPAKPLHTIPEDGEVVGAFEFVPKWLRDLFASRPNEDLVVCIAGCSPHRDRVVYARLKELPDAPPVAVAPAPKPPVAAGGPATPPVEKLTDEAAKEQTPAFVPTFNLPLDDAAGAEDRTPADSSPAKP